MRPKQFVNHLGRPKVQLGIKTLLAGLSAITFNWVAFLFIMFAPMAVPMTFALGDVPIELKGQEKLLEAVNAKAKETIDQFRNEFKQLIVESKAGMLDQKTFDDKLKELTDKLKGFDAEKYKTFETTLEGLTKTIGEQREALQKQSAEIKKAMEAGPLDGDATMTPFRKKLKEFLAGSDYKAFADAGGRRGMKAGFEAKAVDLTSSFTGATRFALTSRSPRIVDHPPITRLNIRDLLNVGPADLPYLSFLEVYDWIRNVGVVSENGMLPESSFKIREAETGIKRIGTFVNLSKRMLKSLPFVEGYLNQSLPAQVRFAEDFLLLFGDGAGNNPLGLAEVARDFVTEVNTSIVGLAGAVSSIASYDGGTKTLVTFAANQDIVNGDKIVFTGFTPAGYNAAGGFNAIVKSPREIIIETAYVADAVVNDVTFVVTSRFKNAIPFAQEIDVLKVAKALVTRREYSATGIVIHPDDAVIIETLKKSDQGYLDVDRFENGIMRIAGVPVVETTAMPAGKFMVGDFSLATALLEFTPLIMEMSESTQEKLTNTVVAIIQEEILFPVYNRYMFVMGDFTAAKAAILKP